MANDRGRRERSRLRPEAGADRQGAAARAHAQRSPRSRYERWCWCQGRPAGVSRGPPASKHVHARRRDAMIPTWPGVRSRWARGGGVTATGRFRNRAAAALRSCAWPTSLGLAKPRSQNSTALTTRHLSRLRCGCGRALRSSLREVDHGDGLGSPCRAKIEQKSSCVTNVCPTAEQGLDIQPGDVTLRVTAGRLIGVSPCDIGGDILVSGCDGPAVATWPRVRARPDWTA